MKRIVVVALLASGLALTLAGLSEADVTEQVSVSESNDIYTDPNDPFNPYDEDPYPDYGDDECDWETSEFCEDPPCIACPTECYTCFLIPEGPNGEPSSWHCDTNNSGGYNFCSEHASGCSLSGDCGSFQ